MNERPDGAYMVKVAAQRLRLEGDDRATRASGPIR